MAYGLCIVKVAEGWFRNLLRFEMFLPRGHQHTGCIAPFEYVASWAVGVLYFAALLIRYTKQPGLIGLIGLIGQGACPK